MKNLSDYLCFTIRAAVKKIDKNLNQRLEETGISIPQSFILFCLQEEDGLTLKEIGTRALIDSSSMTVLVDKLEKDNLVERKLDSQDRRAIRVYITERGNEITKQLSEIASEFNTILYDALGEGNQKEFVHGLKNIINDFD